MKISNSELKTATITIEMMMARHPCPEWPRERIASFLGEGKTIVGALRDSLTNNQINPRDAISGVVRFLPDYVKRAFGIWCARQCNRDIEAFRLYVDTMEKYYAGAATKEELAAVCPNDTLAELAFCSASKFAVNWAAMAAEMEAVEDHASGYGAARKKQVLRLIEMIEKLETNPDDPDDPAYYSRPGTLAEATMMIVSDLF